MSNWLDTGKLFIFALLSTAFTGSLFLLLMRIIRAIFHIENPYDLLLLQKLTICFFSFPFVFAWFFVRQVRFFPKSVVGNFWIETSASMKQPIFCLRIVWLVGASVAVVRYIIAKRHLKRVWKQNEAVTDVQVLAVFQQQKQKLDLPDVKLYRNRMLHSPIAAKQRERMIVLPNQVFTEKELYMIFAHELNHLKYHDIWWRKLMLFARWLHWYLPFLKMVERELVEQQEFVCDLRASVGQEEFSQKEYGRFLVSLTDNKWKYPVATALCEKETMMIRRLRMMGNKKYMKKLKTKLAVAICVGLILTAFFPASAVTAKMIAYDEQGIRAAEVAVREEPQRLKNSSAEQVTNLDICEREIDLSDGVDTCAAANVSYKVPAHTRVIFETFTLSKGDEIIIVMTTNDENAVYRIGVRNTVTGQMAHLEGTGTQTYTYTAKEAGTYAVYAENCTDVSIKVQGMICCEK